MIQIWFFSLHIHLLPLTFSYAELFFIPTYCFYLTRFQKTFYFPDILPVLHNEPVSLLIQLTRRFWRSRMDVRRANTKFLEGMLLISYVKEMWELSKLHVEEVAAGRA